MKNLKLRKIKSFVQLVNSRAGAKCADPKLRLFNSFSVVINTVNGMLVFIRITLGALNTDAWALPNGILIYWPGVGHGLSP